MKRDLLSALAADMHNKILLLTGPRQCGKTTLSKMLTDDYQYLNYDLAEHRLLLSEKSWDRSTSLVIFDELQKMPKWKSWLKGVYDVEGLEPAMIVTGSARLSAFQKTGDSLAGRHFHFRLHPLDMAEACRHTDLPPDEVFDRLMRVGGFPEPFLNGSDRFYNRWKRSHIDLILREDLISLTAVRDVQAIETLIELLRSRVGSPVSANSLAEDLQKSHTTVRNWLKLLEDLHVIFKVTPFHRSIARSLLQQPKYYFYDNAMVKGDDGVKLENLVACALLKARHYAIDALGENIGLHYLRDKHGREIDFLITREDAPHQLIEVKWQDANLSKHFERFLPELTITRQQVVGTLDQRKTYPNGASIEPARDWLRGNVLQLL